MQNLGGQRRSIAVFSQLAYGLHWGLLGGMSNEASASLNIRGDDETL